MEPIPYFWLRNLSTHLHEMKQAPPFGNVPPIDWHDLSENLAARFGLNNLTLTQVSQGLRPANELLEGMGSHPVVLPIKVGPLNGSAYWICAKENVEKLTSWIASPLSKGSLAEGFYRYLLLQALDAISSFEPFHDLSPILSQSTPPPDTDAFCIDVEMTCSRGTCWGRLAFDPELRKNWVEHFALKSEDILNLKLAQTTPIGIGIKIGSSRLKREEWDGVAPGDFIILDRNSYDSRKQVGTAYLMLGESPLFSVKIKQNKIQLIDYAFINEEQMAENTPPEVTEHLPEESGPVTSLKELPVDLTIELARYKVTLEKLMQLTPGTVIELPVRPDQPVKLMINGHLVGHAELVHLGEALGIRILDLG